MGHRPMSTPAAFRSRCHGEPGTNRAGLRFPSRLCRPSARRGVDGYTKQVREALCAHSVGLKPSPWKTVLYGLYAHDQGRSINASNQ